MNKNDPTRCSWHGPFTFRQLLMSNELRGRWRVPGVYIWTNDFENPTKILYVGRATGNPTLWDRMWKHYISLIAGHYEIPDWIRESRWIMDPANPNVRETIFNRERYATIVDDGFQFANGLALWLCPLDTNVVKTIERQLLFDLKPTETIPGTKTEPSERLDLIHDNAGWLNVKTNEQIVTPVVVA